MRSVGAEPTYSVVGIPIVGQHRTIDDALGLKQARYARSDLRTGVGDENLFPTGGVAQFLNGLPRFLAVIYLFPRQIADVQAVTVTIGHACPAG